MTAEKTHRVALGFHAGILRIYSDRVFLEEPLISIHGGIRCFIC